MERSPQTKFQYTNVLHYGTHETDLMSLVNFIFIALQKHMFRTLFGCCHGIYLHTIRSHNIEEKLLWTCQWRS